MGKFKLILLSVSTILLAVFGVGCIKSPTSNKPPSKPNIVSPADGQSNIPINTQLQWTASDPDGDALRYDVYFGAGYTPSLLDSNHTDTFFIPAQLNYSIRYNWKIIARDDHNSSTSSDSYYFITVADSIPGAPILNDPANGSIVSDSTPLFNWNATMYAYRYELLVDNDSDWTSPEIHQEDLSGNNYAPISALGDGIFYWRVRVRNSAGVLGNWSATWNFTVDLSDPIPDAPVLFEPDNGSTISYNLPYFDWNDPLHAYRYEIIVDNNSNWTSPEIHQDALSESNYTPSSDLGNGRYYWKVRAGNSGGVWGDWSVTWSFTVDVTYPVPNAPTLYEPANDSTINDSIPYFDWNDPQYTYRYELIIDNNSSWTSPEIHQEDLSGSNYTPISALDDSTYYWRVRARNSVGVWGDWSNTWSFTIDTSGPVPEAPILYEPANGSDSAGNTPYFDWNDPEYASRYEILVDNNSNFSSPEIHYTGIDVSNCSMEGDLQVGLYFWKVRANNSEGVWGDWSNIWTFTVVNP